MVTRSSPGAPGTYLNSLYELRDFAYPEEGYGDPEEGQSVVNAPDGSLVRLTVGDEPFDARTGRLARHERTLDLRAGVLTRETEWIAPGGGAVGVRSTRLVSFARPAIAVIAYEVRALETEVRIQLDSDLLANAELPEQRDDPRAVTPIRNPLEPHRHSGETAGGLLQHHTRRSGIRVAAAVGHRVHGAEHELRDDAVPDRIRSTVTALLAPGEAVRLVKVVAYAWSDLHDADRLAADGDPGPRRGTPRGPRRAPRRAACPAGPVLGRR